MPRIDRMRPRRPMREVVYREVPRRTVVDRYGNEKASASSWKPTRVSSVQLGSDPFWSTTVETADIGDMIVHAGRRDDWKVGERLKFEGVVYTISAIQDPRHPDWSSGLLTLTCEKSSRAPATN